MHVTTVRGRLYENILWTKIYFDTKISRITVCPMVVRVPLCSKYCNFKNNYFAFTGSVFFFFFVVAGNLQGN